ncbi:initiator RepB protein [Bacillus cereus]|uniref:replication initiation protein n=1 Tax=Bacillus cereus TaxID=1396 RepID=UPI000BFDA798|nr:replication initiation protein [Bacillus cereus]PGP18670.1 initiator RepB protein [Bacillus cereus]
MTLLKPDDLVRKGNPLVEASYKLGLLEQKLIITVASRINKNDAADTTYRVNIKEFCDLMGVKTTNKYSELKKITFELMRKVFQIKLNEKTLQVAWFSAVIYNDREGSVDFQFSSFIKDYLFELQKNFTTYQLRNVVGLKKTYSIRLYEILKRHTFPIKEKTFNLEELKKMLGVEGEYDLYGNFKARVLKPAQKELKEKTDISFEYTEIKKARKVESIHFIINQKEQILIEEKTAIPTEDEKEILNTLNEVGLSARKDLIVKWAEYGASKVIDLIHYSIDSNKDNPIGFVRWAIKNKYTAATFRTAKGRTELIPLWLKEQKEEDQSLNNKENEKPKSEENLEEEKKRLEEVLAKYKRD